jgi:hypothetical protein
VGHLPGSAYAGFEAEAEDAVALDALLVDVVGLVRGDPPAGGRTYRGDDRGHRSSSTAVPGTTRRITVTLRRRTAGAA